jgi:zinc protease
MNAPHRRASRRLRRSFRRGLSALPAALTGLVALLCASAGTPPAGAVPATPPAPQPLRELRFPAFVQQTLANGLRVVLIERHGEPEVSLRLMVPAGRLYETTARAGVAAATAAQLTQGTTARSAQQIAAAIDGVGGNLSASSGVDFAFAAVEVTADQLGLALDLLSDVALHPSFPDAELERWRRKTLSSLELQRANAGYLADLAFQRLVFGGYPYGLPQTGTPDSVRALTRDDLVAFHRAHFLPNGAILAVVGDFQPPAALAGVERAFGGWQRGEAPPPPPLALPSYDHDRVLVIDKPDAVQTQIRVGQAAIAYTDPDYFTATIYGTVLGGSSSARLFQEIRRKRGLAYGAYCGFGQLLTTGSFAANTSTKTNSTVEALGLTRELIAAMGKTPVPQVELDEAKTYLNGAFPLDIETAGRVAARVLTTLSYGLGRDFLDSYRQRISAVTAADVERFGATRLHPDRMVVVLVGNAAAFGADLAKQVGTYETIPAADFDPLAPDLRRPARGATP